MSRRLKQPGVYGPYQHGFRFRVQLVNQRGETKYFSYATREQAKQVKRSMQRELDVEPGTTVKEAVELYETYLRNVKQNKESSIRTTLCRLHAFFTDDGLFLEELSETRGERLYAELVDRVSQQTSKKTSVDSHRNTLAEVKTFLGWCAAKDQRWIARNPLTKVEGIGKRRHGKPQLRIDEARKWLAEAKTLADAGEPGAVAAMMSLLMGVRCSEIVERVVRDLDDEGRLLWIPETKTEAGRRKLAVPPMLQPYLVALTEAKLPGARLFGYHTREWPRHWVKRICKKAHVPEVTAHGMRGLHSSLALAAGTSSQIVAASLGHESIATTLQSYADPSAVSHGKQQIVLHVLEGGK